MNTQSLCNQCSWYKECGTQISNSRLVKCGACLIIHRDIKKCIDMCNHCTVKELSNNHKGLIKKYLELAKGFQDSNEKQYYVEELQSFLISIEEHETFDWDKFDNSSVF